MSEIFAHIQMVLSEFQSFKRRNPDYQSIASELEALKSHMRLLEGDEEGEEEEEEGEEEDEG